MNTALLLVDHGSRRRAANDLLARVADLVRHQAPERVVEIAHMELARPTIAEGFDACVAAGAQAVIVVPYMLVPGRHAGEDIPRLVESAAAGHPDVRWSIAEPIGLHPAVAGIVLDRAGEAEADGWR